ncbi:MAG: lysylphosphatidylglycerol synthase transmembrane domain-containing protein [Enhygromyxa sp.]
MSSDEPSPVDPVDPVDPVVVPRVGPKQFLGFGVGVVLFVLVLRYLAPDWDALRASVSFDLRYAALGLLGTTLASFVTAARWRLLAEVMGGTKLGFATYFYALVMTRVLGQFLPTVVVDLAGRGMALRSAGSKRGLGHAATQVVLERMFDGLLPIVLLLWALSVRQQWLPLAPVASLVGFCLGFLLFAIPFLRPGVRVALRLYLWAQVRLRPRRRAQVEADADAELAETPAVDAKLASKVALLSLARYATVMLQFWGIARAIGVPIAWDQMVAAASIAQLAGLLSLTPGGLGILEAGWAGGLGWVGLGPEPISLFVLAQRLGIISFFSVLTALSWPFANHQKRKLQALEAQQHV